MIHVTETLLARRVHRLSLALVADPNRSDDSTPVVRFSPSSLHSPWRAVVAGRPTRKRGRWFSGRGTTPHGALAELVDSLREECKVCGLDAQQILRNAELVDYV